MWPNIIFFFFPSPCPFKSSVWMKYIYNHHLSKFFTTIWLYTFGSPSLRRIHVILPFDFGQNWFVTLGISFSSKTRLKYYLGSLHTRFWNTATESWSTRRLSMTHLNWVKCKYWTNTSNMASEVMRTQQDLSFTSVVTQKVKSYRVKDLLWLIGCH